MDQVKDIEKFLKAHDIDYEVFHHAPAYTAQETAEAQHVPGEQLVKSVIVKGDEGYIMCVLPATHRLDFDRLEKGLGKRNWYLASEEELAELFPGVELGAEPPFGELPIYADERLKKDEWIYFNGGDHTTIIRMRYADWQKLANAKVLSLGVHA